MFRARLRIPRAGLALRPRPVLPRCLHTVPALDGVAPSEGIPGLLSPDGFNLAYTQYMQFATEKLNALTEGTELEHDEPATIISKTAREPSQAPIFNYASMVFNSHFFFKNLKPKDPAQEDGSEVNPVPKALEKALQTSFSSMETLRLEMTLTANAMFGPGFVWLVRHRKTQDFRILTTYLAGSPLPAAHWRRQPVDTNTVEGPYSTEDSGAAAEFLSRTQRGAGALNGSDFQRQAPGGIDIIPLLCVNTWEHVWLRDYGVGANNFLGKRAYLDNWWHCIDWAKVADLAQIKQAQLLTK